MSNIRGYQGFYKNMYLRSSYEYVYCIILETLGVEYKYEEKIYDLGYTRYKPDFHIYRDGKLVEITEIKSERRSEIKKAKYKISALKRQVDVPIKIYHFLDLKRLCEESGLDIKTLISKWREISTGYTAKGDKNPMYKISHTDTTKKLIGKKSLERWKDPEFVEKIKKSYPVYTNENPHPLKGRIKSERVSVNCLECNKPFVKIVSDVKVYCSKACSLVSATKIAHDTITKNRKKLHKNIKMDIFMHINKHPNLIVDGENKGLYKELLQITSKHGINDIRTVKFMFMNTYAGSFNTFTASIKEQYVNYLKYMPNLQDEKL